MLGFCCLSPQMKCAERFEPIDYNTHFCSANTTILRLKWMHMHKNTHRQNKHIKVIAAHSSNRKQISITKEMGIRACVHVCVRAVFMHTQVLFSRIIEQWSTMGMLNFVLLQSLCSLYFASLLQLLILFRFVFNALRIYIWH